MQLLPKSLSKHKCVSKMKKSSYIRPGLNFRSSEKSLRKDGFVLRGRLLVAWKAMTFNLLVSSSDLDASPEKIPFPCIRVIANVFQFAHVVVRPEALSFSGPHRWGLAYTTYMQWTNT